jgi:hypothetical protein
VKAPFSIWLIAEGEGSGTEDDPVLRGGVLEVDACSIEGEPDTALLSIISSRDTMLCVRTISFGTELTFTIVDDQSDPRAKLQLRLPNDPEFRRLYHGIRAVV